MADRGPDTEEILKPEHNREQLAPEAREPKSGAIDEGWGAWYPDSPLIQNEDKPLLDAERLVPAPGEPEGVDIAFPRIPNEQDPWGSPVSRDIRRETLPPTPEHSAEDEPGNE